jgi:diaminohydroxyphosphoribosylaminopyrimidine deaminase/5-amino-6-(5-phosphoribosylamino)uracil reductase
LTDRSGKKRTRPLIRVLLDETLKIPLESQLARSATESPVLIFAGDADHAKRASLESAGVEVIQDSANGRDLMAILKALGQRSLQSLLVEGGANVAGNFLDAGLVNKVTFFIAPVIIGGHEAPPAVGGKGAETLAAALELKDVEITQRGRDVEITGYPRRKDEDG